MTQFGAISKEPCDSCIYALDENAKLRKIIEKMKETYYGGYVDDENGCTLIAKTSAKELEQLFKDASFI